MKTVNIVPYDMVVASATETTVAQTQPYPIKDALVNILFARRDLKAREILQRDDIGRKILCSEGSLLLEDAEFEVLKSAVETMDGFSRTDAELVRRILTVQ